VDARRLQLDRVGRCVLVLAKNTGRGKSSGFKLGRIPTRGAIVFRVCDGKVTALFAYTNRDRALAELGLDPEQTGSLDSDHR
jgi:hypothetical protein